MKRLLLLDNHDSFTWNIVRLVEEISDFQVIVVKYSKLRIESAAIADKIIFSPGPGLPSEIPAMGELLAAYQAEKPFLGICLGHQAIAEVYGWSLFNMDSIQHGQICQVRVTDPSETLFYGLGGQFQAGLYHSWAVTPKPVDGNLTVTALSENGVVMAIRHRQYDIRGVQFHPESFMTRAGAQIMGNWLTD